MAYVFLHSMWTEQDLCKVNSVYKGQLDDEKAAIYCKQKAESKTYIATRTMWVVYRENLVTDN